MKKIKTLVRTLLQNKACFFSPFFFCYVRSRNSLHSSLWEMERYQLKNNCNIPPLIDTLPPLLSDLSRLYQDCGVLVANSRINGVLAVSRAFGDAQHKVQWRAPIQERPG